MIRETLSIRRPLYAAISSLGFVVLAGCILYIESDLTIAWLQLIYSSFLLLICLSAAQERVEWLKPSVWFLLYAGVLYSFGGVFLHADLYFEDEHKVFFERWGDLTRGQIYYSACLLLATFAFLLFPTRSRVQKVEARVGPELNAWLLIPVYLALIAASFFELLPLPIESKAFLFRLALLSGILWALKDRSAILLSVIGFVLIVAQLPVSIHDKREFILMTVPLMVVFFFKYPKPHLTFKWLVVVASLVVASVSVIAYMSIERGYLGLDDTLGPFEKIQIYFLSDRMLLMLGRNTEAVYAYYTSHNLIYGLKYGSLEHDLGFEYLRSLLIFFPNSIFGLKPPSLMDIYTLWEYPEFRLRGGSYPVHLAGEAYYHFSYIGTLWVFLQLSILTAVFNRLYGSIGRPISAVFFSGFIFLTPIFIRGGGLDLFLIYVIIYFAITLPVAKVSQCRILVKR